MEKTKTTLLKRLTTLMVVFAMVFTTVISAVPVKAAKTELYVVSSVTLKKGEKFQLDVYSTKKISANKITYKSSKKSVATVSKKGVVTAKKKGTATITTTVKIGNNTYQAKTKIRVKAKTTYADTLANGIEAVNDAYAYIVALAVLNGWDEDETFVEWVENCTEVIAAANEMAKNPGDYTEKDFKAMLELLEAILDDMETLEPIISEPNA